MTFGEKLEVLTKEKGWSYAALARRVGTNSTQISRWRLQPTGTGRGGKEKVREEGGKRHEPNNRLLIRLADELGVDARWLIDEAMDMDDRPGRDDPILRRIRSLTPEERLEMWSWHVARSSSGRDSHPDERETGSTPTNRRPVKGTALNGE